MESGMPPEPDCDNVFHRLSQPKQLQERSWRRETSIKMGKNRDPQKTEDALRPSEDQNQGHCALEPATELNNVSMKKITVHKCSLNPYIGLAVSSQGPETSFFKVLRHVIENFEGMGFLTRKVLNDNS
jgi:hypothetical protein